MFALREIISEFELDEVYFKKIGRSLRDWGLCPNCILRFIFVKNQNIYQIINAAELNKWMDDLVDNDNKGLTIDNFDKPVERGTEVCCRACLGILQKSFCFSNSNFISKVVDMVNKQNFEFIDFYCALSLPVSLLIREHSVYVALNELYPEVYQADASNNINNSSSCNRNNYVNDRYSIAAVREVWKWLNGPELSRQLDRPFNQKSPFEIQIHFEYKNDNRECSFLKDLSPKDFQKRKNSGSAFNRNNITKILKDTKCKDFKKFCKVPMSIPLIGCHCEVVVCSNQSVFVAGSRTLSQTPWFVDGIKKFENSVEEIICKPIAEQLFGSRDYKFSSSGREDVDVRMLGRGRPFLIEVINPRKISVSDEEFQKIEMFINGGSRDVFIRDVQMVNKEETHHLKEGEQEKLKIYKALCIMKGSICDDQLININKLKDIELQQKTPIRVLHRRPLATRTRTVHELKIDLINIHRFEELDDSDVFKVNTSVEDLKPVLNSDVISLFVLHLTTQAGTYVKEFVHGDFSRTMPNLSTLLGCECDILQLDVADVLLNWPPSLSR
ncbi:hypothetical protein HELRODRAFT_179923 [Helobdella robusta]|uniref:tRNA pseudouridine(55) synthase n=1 Tax=Helobdella robusta TaxID=6412 RepID=T1FF92_HELRO|nr:hypothetical protein HELRODRAFT_179923 [Helobdella robusta]ESN95061.1 hypothetical protein HELRODRAFT_179923 [Helobdella robusta]